jgi:hypothetical protein
MFSSSIQATQPPCPSHRRLSLLAALQRDGPGWNTSRRFTSSQIHDQRMSDNVHELSVYFLLTIIIFFWTLLKYLIYMVLITIIFLC